MTTWIQLDDTTWTQAGSDFVYHVTEDAVGIVEGLGSFNIHEAQRFLAAAQAHVQSVSTMWRKKPTEIVVLNAEVRALLAKASPELRVAYLMHHGNYDIDIDPLFNPDWCRGKEKEEMERFRLVEARLAKILNATVVSQ